MSFFFFKENKNHFRVRPFSIGVYLFVGGGGGGGGVGAEENTGNY